jgi:hypothetical protein
LSLEVAWQIVIFIGGGVEHCVENDAVALALDVPPPYVIFQVIVDPAVPGTVTADSTVPVWNVEGCPTLPPGSNEFAGSPAAMVTGAGFGFE